MPDVLNLHIRVPVGTSLADAMDVAEVAQHLRHRLKPREWEALERLALALLSAAAIDQETAEVLVRAASAPRG